MLRLKACPRCLGDQYLRTDTDGAHWACLLCGLTVAARPVDDRWTTGRSREARPVSDPQASVSSSANEQEASRDSYMRQA